MRTATRRTREEKAARSTLEQLQQALRVIGLSETQTEWWAVLVLLKVNRVALTGLAKELGVSGVSLGQVAFRPHLEYQNAIARKVGWRPEDLWPSRYRAPLRQIDSREEASNVEQG